jgi:hypothetical protein
VLKERRELLEYEIRKIHKQASQMYLDIVLKDGDVKSPEYEQLKNRIQDLKFEYEMVQTLVRNNQE